MTEFILNHRESFIVLSVLLIIAIPANILAYWRNRQSRKEINQFWQDKTDTLQDMQDGE